MGKASAIACAETGIVVRGVKRIHYQVFERDRERPPAPFLAFPAVNSIDRAVLCLKRRAAPSSTTLPDGPSQRHSAGHCRYFSIRSVLDDQKLLFSLVTMNSGKVGGKGTRTCHTGTQRLGAGTLCGSDIRGEECSAESKSPELLVAKRKDELQASSPRSAVKPLRAHLPADLTAGGSNGIGVVGGGLALREPARR